MDLTFVLLTWNSERYLERCMATIISALGSTALTYEVHVLDNGSTDRTVEILKQLAEKHSRVLVPYFETCNTGTTKSRNRLLAVARGEFICVVDSDVELKLGVIETLLPYLDVENQVGIVVPSIFYPSGAWQKSFDRFPTLTDKVNRFFRLREIEKAEAQQFESSNQSFQVDYAISAFWLMRRSTLQTVGFLDERIFYAPEDVDYCLRVWKSGFCILYVPAVSVIHHTQEISRGFKINRAKLSHIKGLAYYFVKHRYLFRRPAFSHTMALAGADTNVQ